MNKSKLFPLPLSKRFVRKTEKKSTAGSFFEQAKDLCGIAKLPKNLSTHTKHMEKYGEKNQSTKNINKY